MNGSGGPRSSTSAETVPDRLRLFVEAGFDAYHFEWQVDARKAVDVVNHEMALIGNIANRGVLFGGTPGDVYRQVRYSIEAGVDVIAPECAVPLQTPSPILRRSSKQPAKVMGERINFY